MLSALVSAHLFVAERIYDYGFGTLEMAVQVEDVVAVPSEELCDKTLVLPGDGQPLADTFDERVIVGGCQANPPSKQCIGNSVVQDLELSNRLDEPPTVRANASKLP